MKSDPYTGVSGSGNALRRATTGDLPYMSERQTDAYLMARDTIRRIQRTSSIADSISNDAAQQFRAPNRQQNLH